MTAQILNGKQLAQQIRTELKQKISLTQASPSLSVIIVGNDPASEIYVRSKEKACNEVGIKVHTYKLASDISAEELNELIDLLNNSRDVNGILVQLPLPKHLSPQEILTRIKPEKDVDGFHPLNTGLVLQKQPSAFIPCTPKGILRLIHSVKGDLSGLNAVVIGRSHIVGLPVSHLLLNENCTVTIAHSKTKNLPDICKKADILIASVGKPEFITKDYIKPGAIIIDVGINRTQEGLKGDVKYGEAIEKASYITPVPGGVGPMTIAMLLENTYEAFLKQNRS